MKFSISFRSPFGLLIVAVSLIYGIAGYYFQIGWPAWVMALTGLILGFIIPITVYMVLRVLFKRLNRIQQKDYLYGISTICALIILTQYTFKWPETIFYSGMGILIVSAFLLYFGINKRPENATYGIGAILLSFLLLAGSIYWLYQDGKVNEIVSKPSEFYQLPTKTLGTLGIDNPSNPGNHTFSTFTYGSGTDAKRSEYAEGVTYRTESVDGSKLLPDWKEKKKKWREKFWKFPIDSLPLNARVTFPEGEGPFPLILIVHGNHSMLDYSDGGYEYLGEMFASKGFISVSVDENFLNGHWSGDFMGKEMALRAWILLKHLENWQNWNEDKNHDLYGKIDMNQLMLIGHSRGGEAVSIAAAFNKMKALPENALVPFNFNFNIKGVVALAPTDYRYAHRIPLENVHYLSLQGSYDSDEASFWGLRAFRRLQFTDSSFWMKAGVYIHGANHSQFNTSWGTSDAGPPSEWLLNRGSIISQENQRSIAKLYLGAFSEVIFNHRKEYLPLFQNSLNIHDWLPDTYILDNYSTSGFTSFANFENDIDPGKDKNGISYIGKMLKTWKEEQLKARDNGSMENHAVVLGWDYGDEMEKDSIASWTMNLTEHSFNYLDSAGYLKFSISQVKLESSKRADSIINKSVNFTISLSDHAGKTAQFELAEVIQLAPPLLSIFAKTEDISNKIGKSWEPQFQTVLIPIGKIYENNPELNLSNIREIQLVFDKTLKGEVILDDFEYSRIR